MDFQKFNESKDPSSNSKMIEISIPSINFDRDKYELLSIVRIGPSVTFYGPGGPSVESFDDHLLGQGDCLSVKSFDDRLLGQGVLQ
jgi:hypothetical protein